jgi:hypothetical protein
LSDEHLERYLSGSRVGDGQEVKEAGWPELTSLTPWDEKGSSNLSIVTDRRGVTRLYVAHAGYPGDRGDYQGHLTVIDLGSGSQVVFNASCTDQAVHFRSLPQGPGCLRVQTEIWARGGVVYDSSLQVVAGADGAPRMVARWNERAGGTSPVIAHDVLFHAGSSRLRALNPRDGRVLWENDGIGRIHRESPIVVNCRLYLTDERGNLTAFGLKG